MSSIVAKQIWIVSGRSESESENVLERAGAKDPLKI